MNWRQFQLYKTYKTACQSTWGHSVQLAHAVLTTPWMSLLLWGCSWLCAGLRVNRACPDRAMLLQTFFWHNLAGVTTTLPPVTRMYLKCVSDQHVILDTYHARVNLFQFHCIEHWHMQKETSSQAPSYARRLQPETMTHPLTDSLTGVKCRATSVAKNIWSFQRFQFL